MERININKIPGLSGYKLSHIVNHLKLFKPSLRYPNRVDRTKSNVLRALCDRYPNVWPGLPEIADKAKCSTAQTRRALRELEFKDKLIVDVNSRLKWRRDGKCWILEGPDGHTEGKKGGRGKNATVQYFICDRKILDIYYQQEAHKRDKKAHSKLNHGSQQTQSREHESSIVGAPKQPQAPSPMIEEPIRVLTDQEEPEREPTTSQPPEVVEAKADFSSVPKEQIPASLERMAGKYAARYEGFLNLAGKPKILDLRKTHGEETVERVWDYWLERRNIDGLNHPLIAFAEEFPIALAAMEDECRIIQSLGYGAPKQEGLHIA